MSVVAFRIIIDHISVAQEHLFTLKQQLVWYYYTHDIHVRVYLHAVFAENIHPIAALALNTAWHHKRECVSLCVHVHVRLIWTESSEIKDILYNTTIAKLVAVQEKKMSSLGKGRWGRYYIILPDSLQGEGGRIDNTIISLVFVIAKFKCWQCLQQQL